MNVTSSNSSALEANLVAVQRQSLLLLSFVNQGPSQLFVISGLLSFFASISIIATIISDKRLHKKNYILVACLAQSDCLLAICLVTLGLRRILAFHRATHTVVTQFQCLLEEAPRVFSIASITGFFCTCALDRLLAVATPKWYSMVYPKWLFLFIIVINYVRPGIEVGVLFLGTSQQPVPLCAFTAATSQDIIYAQTIRNKIMLSIICFLFVATMATVYYRLGRVKRQGGNVQDSRKQMQTKVLWTLTVMLTCYVVTIIVNSIVFLFIYDKALDVQIKFAAFSVTFQEISAVCNFLILLKNGDFRLAFLNLRKFNKCTSGNRVKPVTSIRGPTTFFKKFDGFSKSEKIAEKTSNIGMSQNDRGLGQTESKL